MKDVRNSRWFTYPEVVQELRRSYPPRPQAGCNHFPSPDCRAPGNPHIGQCPSHQVSGIWWRPVTLLTAIWSGAPFFGTRFFPKEHRDINIRRIGYVASEITKNGGIAFVPLSLRMTAVRKHCGEMIEPLGVSSWSYRHTARGVRAARS